MSTKQKAKTVTRELLCVSATLAEIDASIKALRKARTAGLAEMSIAAAQVEGVLAGIRSRHRHLIKFEVTQ